MPSFDRLLVVGLLLLSACTGAASSPPAGGGTSATNGDAALFACGNERCDPKTQYCLTEYVSYHADASPQGAPAGFSPACAEIPSSCAGAPDCSCLVKDPLAPSDVTPECLDEGGAFRVTTFCCD